MPTEPLRANFKHFPWRKDSAWLRAWQEGRTGFPIVDAGMRERWATGWMHNRVRMLVASFLVKDLLMPWQEGASWFWDTLVDADLAQKISCSHCAKARRPQAKACSEFIPGSITSPRFVVSGKGNTASLHPASHGASRLMSRKAANEKFNWKDMNRFLARAPRDAHFRQPRSSRQLAFAAPMDLFKC